MFCPGTPLLLGRGAGVRSLAWQKQKNDGTKPFFEKYRGKIKTRDQTKPFNVLSGHPSPAGERGRGEAISSVKPKNDGTKPF